MSRIGLLVCLGLFVAPLARAQAPVKTETVHFRSGPETVTGYLAMPGSPGRHPALVVIQEWWGLNDWVKEQAREFAQQGYVALAPDLYHGQVATVPAEARKLAQSMPHERAIRDLKAAYDYLAAMPAVEKNKIGSIGWCMGGGLSLQLAIHEPRLAACVIDYGSLVTDPAEINKIKAPLMGNFGADDHGIPPSAVHAFEKALQDAGKTIDAKIYDGAGHAFENENNKTGYRPEASRDAKARTLEFFNKNLK
ncbi:MAG TPA: dienelactone hydrolase family protein [Terriglobia bacterium]|nr:dienelactone hydrolase family protein [Terriglobia bacterium]